MPWALTWLFYRLCTHVDQNPANAFHRKYWVWKNMKDKRNEFKPLLVWLPSQCVSARGIAIQRLCDCHLCVFLLVVLPYNGRCVIAICVCFCFQKISTNREKQTHKETDKDKDSERDREYEYECFNEQAICPCHCGWWGMG